MTSYLLDTNCFIQLVRQRPEAPQVQMLLQGVSPAKLYMTDFTLHSIGVIMRLPSGVSSAPVKVIDGRTGQEHDMRFVAGMFGVVQDPATLTLSPTFGWAVAYEQMIPTKPPRRGFRSRRRTET